MKFLHRLFADIPLIEDHALAALINNPLDVNAAEHPVFKRIKESLKPQMDLRSDGIAVVPIEGALAYKPDVFEMFMGVEDSRNVLEMVNAAAGNPKVEGIVLNIDSPGGMVVGGFEVADAVRAANKVKPVVAWSGGWATSLAYMIGSQAGQFVASRTAQVGSIGAVTSYADYTKMLEARGIKVEVFTNKEATLKAAGMIGTTLTDEQRLYIQGRVDKAFAEFRKAVSATRPQVEKESMKGQVFYASEGKTKGLVDRIGDLNFAVSVARSEIRKRG